MVGLNACIRKHGCGVAQMGGGPISGPGILSHYTKPTHYIQVSQEGHIRGKALKPYL